ncbi:hypothetical protein OL239_02605 [Arthrobacter sp. ATA002]|uniref:hypothetical protein n=1 Tax=Arthrobacter sp. ATA002 TaxID=2991715 RepID=UPI0022A6C78D|nr:hypothetical protein [Arthrobacter sp. ATA002]WAP52216.1 hypothetical protein OL239_02605 [Arthrobacter sp. ATA002]
MLIYEKLYGEEAMSDLRTMVEGGSDDGGAEFEALPADADESTRQRLAETFAPEMARHITDYPWLTNPNAHLAKGPHVTSETFVETFTELYNRAQLDVLARAGALAQKQAAPIESPPKDDHEDGEQ